jgi:hypothetical protein
VKLVYVAEQGTGAAWLGRGYEGALKVWERGLENPAAGSGPYRHGWGRHYVDDDHHVAFAAIAARIRELGLTSYGLDLEFDWDYDGSKHGWGDHADPVELARVEGLSAHLLAAAKVLPVPIWISCLAHKLYPYRLWLSVAQFVSPQLYGERDPLPDADAAFEQLVEQLEGTVALPPRPATPLPMPDWASQMLTWRATPLAKRGPRPAHAPATLPSWWWQWAAWKNALDRRAAIAAKAVPSLWTGQHNPRPDGSCVRFVAEIMADDDYQ